MRCPAFLLGLLSLIIPTATGFAQSGTLGHAPTEVVKHYLALDQKGARLDAMSFETLVPYIDWQQEPAWGRVVIVQDAVVPDDYRQWEIVDRLEVVVPVTFRTIGSVYLETAIFVPEERTEEVRFRVKAVHNRWRIAEPVIPPHVGLRRIQNFVRDAELKETDAEKRSLLAALGESLKKVKP